MSLARRAVVVLLLGVSACGDHYDGGGRRRELPISDQAVPPSLGPSDGTGAGGAGTDDTVDVPGGAGASDT